MRHLERQQSGPGAGGAGLRQQRHRGRPRCARRAGPAPVRAEQANPSIATQLKAAARPLQSAARALLASRGVARPAPEGERLQAALARPQSAAAAAAAFAAVAAGVFGPGAALLPIDAAAHEWVRAHTTLEWRLAVGEHLLSDGPIYLGFAAWIALTGAALLLPPPGTAPAAAPPAAASRAAPPAPGRGAAAAALAACWGVYLAGTGAVGRYDPPLVHALKQAFARVRPSNDFHRSFSFPSGHTTAAVFIIGAALLVLLPLARRRLPGGAGGSGRLPDVVALPAWAGASATVACGRVAADAHWVSDTLAGASLGVACVASLAAAVDWIEAAAAAAAAAGAGEGAEAEGDGEGGARLLEDAE